MPKKRKDGDSKCRNEYAQQLWTPKLKEDDGFECQNDNTALNAKLKRMVALNTKLKIWLWEPKIDESGSEW